MANTKENGSRKASEITIEERAREDGWKLLFDYFKHLTTLSTGSILILVTLLEKLFTNPRWKWLAVVALGSFVLSIFFAILAMHGTAYSVKHFIDSGNDTRSRQNTFDEYACALTFVLGIMSIVVFALINLYA